MSYLLCSTSHSIERRGHYPQTHNRLEPSVTLRLIVQCKQVFSNPQYEHADILLSTRISDVSDLSMYRLSYL